MELNFRVVEFQNAAIGLKNATIGLPEPDMVTLIKKNLQESAAIGLKNVTIWLKNATIGLPQYGSNHTDKKFA